MAHCGYNLAHCTPALLVCLPPVGKNCINLPALPALHICIPTLSFIWELDLCGQVLLDKNLVGHEGGNGVTDCSPSNVAGHQKSESARPDCPSYGQPNCLSAASSALSRLE